jgi:DNA modification methylase|tara:strand:+ start:7953 stop:9197 length:1245 start_codon:yes stop_codon:yes gene_type:complete
MNITDVKIDDITPYHDNPRVNTDAINVVKKSLSEFGFQQPLVLDKDNVIIVGHTRFAAAKELGFENVPCYLADNLSEDKIKAYRIMDNKSAEYASWNYGLLTKEITDLLESDYDLEYTGFSDAELEDMGFDMNLESFVEEPQTDEDVIPEITEDPPISKMGDVWILGNHRLVCGDSTSIDDVEKLMNNERADMIFTDPPWNVNYGDNDNPRYKSRTILNDHMPEDEWADFVMGFCTSLKIASKGGCMTYLVMSAQEWAVVDKTLRDSGFHWSSTIIWSKDKLVLSRKDYHTQYEPIWYGWNADETRLSPLLDRKQSDVWEIPRPQRSELHPTTKPIELVEKAINNSTQRTNLILDLFLGSGSTLIAAEKTGRKCYGMELDPKYADVIVERWQNYTGKNAVLESTDEIYNSLSAK